MADKIKITEIKEYYTKQTRVKYSGPNTGGAEFEMKTHMRFKDVNYVDGWARFGHHILDSFLYYIFIAIIAGPIGIAIAIFAGSDSLDSPIYDIINYVILYPGYYLLFEFSMQSTPAKLILGRVVVNEYGEKPDFTQLLKRSYSRIVPFETFSCLSTQGWHDTWSNTIVIRKKDLKELQLAIKMQEFENEAPSDAS